MDQIGDFKDALVARSRTTSLEDLRSQGRKSVQVIRPEQVAAMVQESVEKALATTNYLPPEEVERLIERGQREFREIIQQREAQIEQIRMTARELEEIKSERVRLEASLKSLVRERDDLLSRNERLERFAEESRRREQDAGADVEKIGELTAELDQLKQEMKRAQEQAPAQPAAAAPDLTAALDKLAGSLNERLDSFGRKMGISSAVEAEKVKLDGLFDRDGDEEVESNMDSVHVKKKTEGGIGSNLERLRKLKGDG